MIQRFLSVTLLLCCSQMALADWLPNPDKWLREQCQQRITQIPNVSFTANQRHQTCQCMVKEAKSQLSVQDLLNLAKLSEAQLQQRYSQQTKTAFQKCQKTTLPIEKHGLN